MKHTFKINFKLNGKYSFSVFHYGHERATSRQDRAMENRTYKPLQQSRDIVVWNTGGLEGRARH
jgi:hypothetical protein